MIAHDDVGVLIERFPYLHLVLCFLLIKGRQHQDNGLFNILIA